MTKLREHLESFLIELERQRSSIRSGQRPFWIDDDGATAAAQSAKTVRDALIGLFERLERELQGLGPGTVRVHAEARYAMAALADEVFAEIETEWPGHTVWAEQPHRLEKRLFDTEIADSEIFRRIERLLARGDPEQRELAEIYFAILSFGFRGRFRGASTAAPPVEVENLRQRLFEFVDRGRSRALAGADRVSASAYASIETKDIGGRLPGALHSLGLLVLVVLSLAGATLLSRMILLGGLRSHVERLETSAARVEAGP